MKLKLIAITAMCMLTQACMTTYDAYGRPVQSVDPGVATAGIIGAGLIGYSLGNTNSSHYHRSHSYGYRPYWRPQYGARHSHYNRYR